MKTKTLLPLALVIAAAALTGCAHQKTQTGSKTNILFGLVEVERGAYASAAVNTIDVNSNESFGDAGKVSGTQTKILWGAITNNDY
jgi:hypothetical protein